MLKEIRKISFSNGIVYALETHDGYPIEVTDTFLPFYTKNAIKENQNTLNSSEITNRSERWMIGVSCMSGCPVRCKFCATGNLKRYRNLTSSEIVSQVEFIINKNKDYNPEKSKEFKINYTRMGEPFLNLENVKEAIRIIDSKYKNVHHYISTIGIKGIEENTKWIKDNITLQISLHSLDNDRRNSLIPFKNKVSIEELGCVRTKSNLKTTLNMTLVDESDFDIELLNKYFDKEHFFIKLSPINENTLSKENNMGKGIIDAINII